MLTFSPIIIYASPPISPEAIVKQAETSYKNGNLLLAADHLEQAINLFQQESLENNKKLAITQTNLCRIQIELGQGEKAIKTCEFALKNHQKLNNISLIQQTKLYQIYALQKVGFYPLACQKITDFLNLSQEICQGFEETIITQSLEQLKTEDQLMIEAWISLGENLRSLGEISGSKIVLQTLLNKLDSNQTLFSKISLSLGNTYTSLGKLTQERISNPQYEYIPWEDNNKNTQLVSLSEREYYNEAKTYYQKAQKAYKEAVRSYKIETKIKAQLNSLRALLLEIEVLQVENEPSLEIQHKINEAEILHRSLNIDQLPSNQFKIYAKLQYIKQKHSIESIKKEQNYSNTIQLLEETIRESRNISGEDNQSLVSSTLGTLGSFYEYLSYHNFDKNSLQKAQKLTEEALYLSQPQTNPYLAYQWQWQLARIEKLQGNNKQAIANYQLAIQTLETVRKNILTIQTDVQFSFRDNIEPLYREFMSSLLQSKTKNISPNVLNTILQQVDTLQLAELENFLQCDLSSQTNIDEITDINTLIIYPVVLKNKLVIIYKIPEKDNIIDFKIINISNQEFTQTIKILQNDLGEIGHKFDIIKQSQQVYQWIIKPLETVLKDNQKIDTLVFILDGPLRNIPISVLYDGENKEYLLQKNYAIAVVPGLNLLQNQTLSLTPNIFLGGVEIEQEFDDSLVFEKIKYLRQELNEVSGIIPNSKKIINEDFIKSNLQQELENNKYSIIHWKTHGVFSSNPDETYIVAYNQLLKTNDINQLINTGSEEKSQPIDLLVLSACETAKGDNRAVLGLAGITVRSGVSSTLSTLWRADDRANTQLMKNFYTALFKPNMSKAKALHQAQLSLYNSNIAYQDPHYWASYILVGNWL